MKPIHRVGIFSIFFAMGTPLMAQTWTGATNANWSVAGNWSPSGVPASGANITISDTTSNGLTIDGSATSRTVGSITNGTTGTRGTTFTLNTQAANTLNIGGGLIANGNLTTTVLTMRGNYVVSANQGWSVGGTATYTSDNGVFLRGASDSASSTPSGSLALNGNLTKSGTGQLVFAAVEVSGAGNLVVDSGTLKFNAGVNQPLKVGGAGNITINGASSFAIVKNSGTLDVTRAIVMNGTSTLSLRNSTVDLASPIAFNGTHPFEVTGTTNLAGAWTGSGTANRSGAGTLNLNGNLTGFTGTLNLTASTTNIAGAFGGSIAVTAGTTTLGGTVGGSLSVTTGATVSGEANATGALTLQDATFGANPLSAASLGTSGNLNLSGTNTVVLTASPSSTAPFTILKYTGTLTGGAANLTLLGGAANYRSVTFSDTTPGIITLALGSANRTWTGAAGTAWDVNTSLNWQEGDQKFLQLDAVTFGNTGAGTVAMTGVLVPGSITVNSTSDYDFTGDAANYIAGGTGLTKSGSGVLSLGGVNTFNGNIAVNGGVLKPTGNQALGANGKTITIATGATLDTNGAMTASRDYRAVISGAGTDTFGAIVNSGGDHTAGFVSLALAADATIGGTGRWDVRPINAGEGLLDLAGHKLTKVGFNKVGIVDSVATANGLIDVNEGTLAITRSSVSGTGAITVNTGANLYFENNTSGSFSKNLALNGGTLSAGGGTLVPIDSPITLTDFPTFQIDANQTVTGAITGTGNLAKSGTAALILTGAATHTGGTSVNAGTLQIGAGGTTGSIAGNINNSATVAFNRSDTYSYTGIMSGTGTLLKQGAGSLILSTANDFTGQKTISDGSVVLRSTTGLGDTAAFVRFTGNAGILDLATNTSVAPYTFTIGAGNSGTILSNVGTPGPGINHTLGNFELSSVTLNVAAGADVTGGDPRITIPTFNLSAGAAGTTTLFPTTANINLGAVTIGTANFAKRIALSGTSQDNFATGAITNGLNVTSLAKFGDSTWTVSGDSTFTGDVTADDGILVVAHTNALGGPVKALIAFGEASQNKLPEVRFTGGISPTVATAQLSGAGTAGTTGVLNNLSGNNTLNVTTQISMRSGNGGTTLYSTAGTFTINTPLITAINTSRVLTLAGPGNGVINGVIADGSTVNLPVIKNGTGTWTLNGAQTYSGATTVNEGVLSLGQASLNDAATVTVAPGAKLNLNFAGEDQVGSLIIDNELKPDGLYTAANSSGFITGTGSIRVGVAPQGYSSWAAGFPFNVGVNDGPTQDPDFDGISNVLEYVLGGIPIGAGAGNPSILPTQTLTATDLILTFKRSDLSESDVTLKVQWSSNMMTWNDFATIGAGDALPAVDVTEDSPTADLDTVVVTIPKTTAPGGKIFARLQAVK